VQPTRNVLAARHNGRAETARLPRTRPGQVHLEQPLQYASAWRDFRELLLRLRIERRRRLIVMGLAIESGNPGGAPFFIRIADQAATRCQGRPLSSGPETAAGPEHRPCTQKCFGSRVHVGVPASGWSVRPEGAASVDPGVHEITRQSLPRTGRLRARARTDFSAPEREANLPEPRLLMSCHTVEDLYTSSGSDHSNEGGTLTWRGNRSEPADDLPGYLAGKTGRRNSSNPSVSAWRVRRTRTSSSGVGGFPRRNGGSGKSLLRVGRLRHD